MYKLQPNTKSRGCFTAFAVIGVLVTMLAACVLFVIGLPFISDVSSKSDRRNVVYRIESDAKMDSCIEFSVTYAMPNGTAQKDIETCSGITNVGRFDGKRGDHLYLSIQNTAPRDSRTRFACMILVDNKSIAQVQSVGWSHIASCSELLR